MDDLERYKTLSNGAVYDNLTHRIVKGAALTSAGAAQLATLRTDRKRAVVREAANNAVQRADYRAKYGDYAYLAAITEAAMLKATTPDDPKAIEAGRWIVREAGDSEEMQPAAGSEMLSAGSIKGILHELAALARALADGQPADDHQPAALADGQPAAVIDMEE